MLRGVYSADSRENQIGNDAAGSIQNNIFYFNGADYGSGKYITYKLKPLNTNRYQNRQQKHPAKPEFRVNQRNENRQWH